jgi:hypothetical protein
MKVHYHENRPGNGPKVKKEGWINIYQYYDTMQYITAGPFKTEALARFNIDKYGGAYKATIKIEWEEEESS